jgi:hypothetical protein
MSTCISTARALCLPIAFGAEPLETIAAAAFAGRPRCRAILHYVETKATSANLGTLSDHAASILPLLAPTETSEPCRDAISVLVVTRPAWPLMRLLAPEASATHRPSPRQGDGGRYRAP